MNTATQNNHPRFEIANSTS